MAMSGHRFFRLRNSGTYFICAELELYEELNGPNVATGGTPIANAIAGWGGDAIENAFDGILTNHWHSPSWGAWQNWIGYDFGAGVTRDIKYIGFARAGDIQYSAANCVVEVSDDGVVWKQTFALSGAGFPVERQIYKYRIYPFQPHERKMRVVDFSAHLCKGRQQYQGSPGQPVIDPAEAPWHMRPNLLRYAQVEFGGLYKLDGTTTSLGEPVSRRVRLYHQFSGKPVAEQITGDDGLFSFTHIEEGPWTVIGVDDTGAQNGVIYSHVKAVPMF